MTSYGDEVLCGDERPVMSLGELLNWTDEVGPAGTLPVRLLRKAEKILCAAGTEARLNGDCDACWGVGGRVCLCPVRRRLASSSC